MKLLSAMKNRLGLYSPLIFGQTKSLGLPNIVIIETTNLCDKECRICVHKNMTRKQGFMDLGLFKSIVDQISFAEVIFPYFLGEPLLHKDIYEMIRYCKSKGLYTSISTDGNLLNEDNCKKIVEAKLDHLQISLNSTNKSGYEAIDPKGDFQAVLENIDRFLSINKGRVDFYVSILNMKCGVKDWQAFVKAWRKKGLEVRFKFFVDWNANDPSIQEFGSFPARRRKDVYPCDWLWQQFHVLWDGRVIPCCFDYDGTQILGDVNVDSIKSIWNGRAYTDMRRAHLNDGAAISLCSGCNRRRKQFYEIPFHVIFDASLIYKMRLLYEKSPRKYFG